MVYQVGACLTYIQQWVADVALPTFNNQNPRQDGKIIRSQRAVESARMLVLMGFVHLLYAPH